MKIKPKYMVLAQKDDIRIVRRFLGFFQLTYKKYTTLEDAVKDFNELTKK